MIVPTGGRLVRLPWNWNTDHTGTAIFEKNPQEWKNTGRSPLERHRRGISLLRRMTRTGIGAMILRFYPASTGRKAKDAFPNLSRRVI
jgi:hypothetical protein